MGPPATHLQVGLAMSRPRTESPALILSVRGRLGAHTLHAQLPDPSAHTAPARAAFEARWERIVDPDGTLAPQDRARRAAHARAAHFARMSLASARARRARSAAA